MHFYNEDSSESTAKSCLSTLSAEKSTALCKTVTHAKADMASLARWRTTHIGHR